MRRCVVCGGTNNVNADGRCGLCQIAYDAARGGTSYGKYQALLYRPSEQEEVTEKRDST